MFQQLGVKNAALAVPVTHYDVSIMPRLTKNI